MFAREFCIVNGKFSDPQCLMNTLIVHYIEVKLYTNLNDSHCNSNSTNDHQVVLQ